MAKVKNTARRVRSPILPVAQKMFRCPKCAKEYGQKSNLARHMGVTHKLTASGEKIDDATLAKYLTYNRGAKRTKRLTESKPSTSGVARAAKTTPDQPAEYPRPDREDRPTSATSDVSYRSHHTKADKAGRTGLSSRPFGVSQIYTDYDTASCAKRRPMLYARNDAWKWHHPHWRNASPLLDT